MRSQHSQSANTLRIPDRRWEEVDSGDLAIAQLVHDLRNQLTLILGFADHLAPVVTGHEAAQAIGAIQQSAERASLLTRELLLAARSASARGPVDLNHVVASAGEKLSRVTGERILLRLRLSAKPVLVVAELIELERIFLNLALNGCDAIAGIGAVTIETAIVDERPGDPSEGRPPAPCARLTVSDTGCGMTPEVEARIFEPFFSTKAKGIGLGLSSVAFTVRQLHGTLLVKSQPGCGTTVSVLLPAAIQRHRRGRGPART